jgi:hypothetical protein
MEKGWLKTILEQARADRETWPAWQRGNEVSLESIDTKVSEQEASQSDDSGDHEAAA